MSDNKQLELFTPLLKATPGPWKIVGQDIIGKGINGYICSWSGNIHDAYLIAAAPDMYKALAELYDLYGVLHEATELALDKARGEA